MPIVVTNGISLIDMGINFILFPMTRNEKDATHFKVKTLD